MVDKGELDANNASFSANADEYGNDEGIEALWAMKAYNHAEIYFNLLSSVDPRVLRLTPHDDVIHEAFTKHFPEMDLHVVNVEGLKSLSGKEKWRPFCNQFEGIVEDFNFGTLLRIDSKLDYTEENTILVPRIQFYAIEIARNRRGYNDDIRETFKQI